ncbi:UNVERIFIED_CONTAM: hypothetical protein FKN15_022969 [Acipenser sinensis]
MTLMKFCFKRGIPIWSGTSPEEQEKDNDLSCISPSKASAVAFSSLHTNVFHVWDQDEVHVPLPLEDSPPPSPAHEHAQPLPQAS